MAPPPVGFCLESGSELTAVRHHPAGSAGRAFLTRPARIPSSPPSSERTAYRSLRPFFRIIAPHPLCLSSQNRTAPLGFGFDLPPAEQQFSESISKCRRRKQWHGQDMRCGRGGHRRPPDAEDPLAGQAGQGSTYGEDPALTWREADVQNHPRQKPRSILHILSVFHDDLAFLDEAQHNVCDPRVELLSLVRFDLADDFLLGKHFPVHPVRIHCVEGICDTNHPGDHGMAKRHTTGTTRT